MRIGYRTYRRVVIASRRLREKVRAGDHVPFPRDVLRHLYLTNRSTRTYAVLGFKHVTGHPPQDFLTVTKLSYACELLDAGKGVVASASLAGFTDHQHLCHVFQRWLGMTTVQYRRLRAPR